MNKFETAYIECALWSSLHAGGTMIPIKQFFAWFKNVAKFGTSFRDCYIAAADADIDGIPYTLAPEFTQSGKPETFEVQS